MSYNKLKALLNKKRQSCEELLSDGGDGTIGIWRDKSNNKYLIYQDDCGFTSFILEKEDWDNFKEKVNFYFKDNG